MTGNKRVEGKVALVTGAASGLGLASAIKLLDEGAKVFFSDINERGLEKLNQVLDQYDSGNYALGYHDVSSIASWNEVLKHVNSKFGKLNIVQNGKLAVSYDEKEASDYMKNDNIEINVDIMSGSKNFTAYTMDFTKKYVENFSIAGRSYQILLSVKYQQDQMLRSLDHQMMLLLKTHL